MAKGNPLLAKKIFDEIDEEWFMRCQVWRHENINAKIPEWIVGMFAKE